MLWVGGSPPLLRLFAKDGPQEKFFVLGKGLFALGKLTKRGNVMQLPFWIMDGLVAGWLTGKIMSGRGRDLLMATIMGVAGGVAGGFIVNVAGLPVQGRMIYTNLAAILGAVVLTALSRVATGRRGYA